MSARPASAASDVTTRLSSAKIRSGDTRSSPSAWSRAAAAVGGATSKPRSIARRASRSVRSGSASNAAGETIRRRRAARSARPPWGSAISPPGRGSARAVADPAPVQRLGHGVDGEVPRGEVGVERPALQRLEVDLPRLPRPDDAPAAEDVGGLERGAAGGPERGPPGGPRDPARPGPGVALEDDVDVVAGGAASEEPVADRAADDPGARVAERLADGLDHGAGAPSRWYARGTRALMPHTIS